MHYEPRIFQKKSIDNPNSNSNLFNPSTKGTNILNSLINNHKKKIDFKKFVISYEPQKKYTGIIVGKKCSTIPGINDDCKVHEELNKTSKEKAFKTSVNNTIEWKEHVPIGNKARVSTQSNELNAPVRYNELFDSFTVNQVQPKVKIIRKEPVPKFKQIKNETLKNLDAGSVNNSNTTSMGKKDTDLTKTSCTEHKT